MHRKPLAAVLVPPPPQRLSWAGMPCSTPAGVRRCARSPTACCPTLRSQCGRPRPSPAATRAPTPTPPGAGTNYVYLVDAADDRGNVREFQLNFFGRESDGEGWLEIEARDGSGVRHRACDAAEAPAAARRALDR